MKKFIASVIIFISFASLKVNAQDITKLLDGLKALDGKLKTAQTSLKAAETKRDTEKPPLDEKLGKADANANDIYANHNDKHEKGSADYSYWNNEYLKYAGESLLLKKEIKKLEDSVAHWQTEHQQRVLERQQKAREIIDLLIGKGFLCAGDLTDDSTPEAMAHCGQVNWDGQQKNLPALDESNIKRGTNFFGADPSIVVDESDEKSRAEKIKKQNALIEKSSATHSTKPIPVAPPAPNMPKKEPTATERLKNILKGIFNKPEPKPQSSVSAVRG